MNSRPTIILTMVSLLVFAAGCRSIYYAAYEKVGVEKRHLLRNNIRKAQEEQSEATEEFTDILTQIDELYGLDGGKLERFYRKLERDYQGCEQRAGRVRDRIEKVERIAKDMFAEWEAEIEQISTASLRVQSEDALRKTRRRYEDLSRAMARAEERMTPVLRRLHEYVLALKHQLNARAIGALEGEADAIEEEVQQLLADMNHSIREAESFLAEF